MLRARLSAVRGGYLTLARWHSASIRVHWTLPIGAFVFGQGRLAPGFWLGFVLLVLGHEIGHAVLVRRSGCHVVSIDVHALGGVCRWQGNATDIQRAQIAWGGVLAQALLFVAAAVGLELAGDPRSMFVRDLVDAFVSANVLMILLNLFPVSPLDGAEAWKLPRLLIARRLARRISRTRDLAEAKRSVERELAVLAREPDRRTKAAVNEILDKLVREPGHKEN